jgi:hypothetical protein
LAALLGILAAPLTSTIGAALGHAASAATAPFASFLHSAHDEVSSPASAEPRDDEPSLDAQVAKRLQSLLAALNVAPGERITFHFDKQTDEIKVSSAEPAASQLQTAIEDDKQLAGDLRKLAKQHDFFPDSPLVDPELEIEPSDNGSTAALRWL